MSQTHACASSAQIADDSYKRVSRFLAVLTTVMYVFTLTIPTFVKHAAMAEEYCKGPGSYNCAFVSSGVGWVSALIQIIPLWTLAILAGLGLLYVFIGKDLGLRGKDNRRFEHFSVLIVVTGIVGILAFVGNFLTKL